MNDADVVIVGAGPVGLTLANLLGQYGVETLVLEAREELIDYPRAVGWMTRRFGRCRRSVS